MDPINWHSFFFLLFAALTAVFAVAVVVTSNVVRMAFYLILSLGATAGLFFLAGADFVGAIVFYDDPSETSFQYAPYTLTVNGVVQPGGS